jgi:LPS-assembly protein
MLRRLLLILLVLGGIALRPADARAQGGQSIPGFDHVSYVSLQVIGNHYKFSGNVELQRGDTKIYADAVEIWTNEHRAQASGNVLLVQGQNRIAADRAEFNTETRLGTFYNASGIATVQPPRQTRGSAVAALPPMTGQDTSVYFFGETVEKQGPKKYKITNGGFSTCVQPTPRWDLHAGTVILNIDHYTVLHQAVLEVKGVPLFYIPILYYPTNRKNRATGILIPTYGSSTLRGQQISNAFFWAIDRSQDATFEHDWYSKTGQGLGGEYRYNWGSGSIGNMRATFLNQHATTYLQNGAQTTVPGTRSYEIIGSAIQTFPGNIRARAQTDYFSSITSMQTFNSSVADSTRNQRTIGANVVGAWGVYSLNGTYNRVQQFYDQSDSTLVGSAPSLSLTRTERPLASTVPVYVSFSGQYARLLYDSRSPNVDVNQSLSRVDLLPQIRYPFKRWEWLTVNASLTWRDTYYTRSLDPTTTDPVTGRFTILDQGLNRRFFTTQAQIVGPVFNRIWDTPNNGYAEKFKHSIEPFLNIARTSSVDNYAQIVQIDTVDSIVGGTTQLTYGVRNRFYAKRRTGRVSQAVEFLTVELTQSYYSNQLASRYDPTYNASFSSAATPSKFSPVLLNVRVAPTTGINATVRAEFDSKYKSLESLAANGSVNLARSLQATVGWVRTNNVGPTGSTTIGDALQTATNVHTQDNHFGGSYSMLWDIFRSNMQNQRLSVFYNAQCCGIAFEWQSINYGALSIVPADHRFFVSFTLAGLGNFSPMNGAMANVPR